MVHVIQGQTTIVALPPPPPVVPEPRLTLIAKTDHRDKVAPGEMLTYTIVVRNDGGSPATNVRVTDRVPDHLIPDLALINPSAVADPATRTITWSGKTVPPGTEKRFSFTVQVLQSAPDGFELTNVAHISAPNFQGSAADTTTVVVPHALEAITASPPRPVPLSATTGMDLGTALLGLGGLCSGRGGYLGRRRETNPPDAFI